MTGPALTHSADSPLARRPTIFLAAFCGTIVVLFLLLALGEQLGIPRTVVTYAAIGLPLAMIAIVGLRARTLHRTAFFHVDHGVPAIPNAMASAIGGFSGLVFIGYAGLVYTKGFDAFAYGIGLAGGYALLAVLFATPLRKARVDTIPDFFAARFDGSVARLIGVAILAICLFPLTISMMSTLGWIIATALGISYQTAISVIFVLVLTTLLLGGMRGLTWTQAAQYLVVTAAFLVPLIWMAVLFSGNPLPQASVGDAVADIMRLEQSMNGMVSAAFRSLGEVGEIHTTFDRFNFLATIVVIAAGTAAFPHLLMHANVTTDAREAQRSSAWALVFLALLLLSAPAYALLVRFHLLSTTTGLSVADLAGQASWLARWGARTALDGSALVSVCGRSPTSVADIAAACGGADHILLPSDIVLSARAIVLAGPEIAGLPFIVTALVALGAMLALLAVVCGLLFSLASALGHDIYAELGDRRAPAPRRLYIARLALFAVAVGTSAVALQHPPDLIEAAAWCFSLAAAGLFPPLVLGLWWPRATAVGAVGGMITGVGTTAAYIVISVWGIDLVRGSGDEITWALPGLTEAVTTANAGIFGLPVGFLTTIVLSLITPAPTPAEDHTVGTLRRTFGPDVATRPRS